ncbi:MAG: TM2 domain-containing protein [Bacteroidetes bacterium]|nr:TM2 domain-containing protein [Bacteroidota bacterium]
MEAQKVDMFLMMNAKFFEPHQIPFIREHLLQADESKYILLQTAGAEFKEPNFLLLISLIGGFFGVDRFLVGDTGLGVAKLLTCGGLYIWTIIDWFVIMGRTREVNFEKLQQILM